MGVTVPPVRQAKECRISVRVSFDGSIEAWTSSQRVLCAVSISRAIWA